MPEGVGVQLGCKSWVCVKLGGINGEEKEWAVVTNPIISIISMVDHAAVWGCR